MTNQTEAGRFVERAALDQLLARTARILHAPLRRRLSGSSVTPAQWLVMALCRLEQSPTLLQLTLLSSLGADAVRRLVERLRVQGLATCSTSARGPVVELTQKGAGITLGLVQAVFDTLEEQRSNFSAREQAVLARMLGGLLDHANDEMSEVARVG
jgi:hypothetical protein